MRAEWLPDALTLAHNTQLRTLRVDVPFLARDGRWVPQLLATAASDVLEALTLDIFVEKAADLDEFDWARAHATLASERMAGLRTVAFVVRGNALGLDEVAAAIDARLPALAKRGMLEVYSGATR